MANVKDAWKLESLPPPLLLCRTISPLYKKEGKISGLHQSLINTSGKLPNMLSLTLTVLRGHADCPF